MYRLERTSAQGTKAWLNVSDKLFRGSQTWARAIRKIGA